MRPNLYFAAPLFSLAEREFNTRTVQHLEGVFTVFLPQVHGGLLQDIVTSGCSEADARRLVFEHDLGAIRACDVLLAVLDGRSIDEGTSFELGYAYCLGKHCIGLQTDIRRMLSGGNNPMIDAALRGIF